MKKPNLFIVGHPRSGTSSMHRYLGQHHDVFMSPIKEPNYFARDFREESDNFHHKQLYFPYRTEKDYLGLYKKWKTEKAAGEASSTNLYSAVSAEEIHRFNPESKIIIMLREPVGFLYSYHSAAQFALGEHHKDFNKALFAEKERKKGTGFSKRVITPSWLFYSEFTKYTEQIQRFLFHFDQEQIKIIIFDDFKRNTQELYREVLEFIGVDSDFSFNFDIVNPNKQVKWPSLKKFILDSPYFRKTMRRIFSNDIYAKMDNFYKTWIVSYEPRQILDSEIKIDLKKKFKLEVEQLGNFLKRDMVSLWGYDKV